MYLPISRNGPGLSWPLIPLGTDRGMATELNAPVQAAPWRQVTKRRYLQSSCCRFVYSLTIPLWLCQNLLSLIIPALIENLR